MVTSETVVVETVDFAFSQVHDTVGFLSGKGFLKYTKNNKDFFSLQKKIYLSISKYSLKDPIFHSYGNILSASFEVKKTLEVEVAY